MRTIESKSAAIRKWLMKGLPLTQRECTRLFKFMRLASLIHDMKRHGANIKVDMVREQYGSRPCARYWLITA
ncbi:MAG: hypothetical protein J5651_00355 [Salinivirgaceae bacterium]|nr:hypothetical protein [Salinivirgaceae bacterium]